MYNPYENRLDASSYAIDQRWLLRLQPHPRDEGSEPIEGGIAERLLGRLRYLGAAYELPLLARLPLTGAVTYPQAQLASIEDELAFVFDVVSDQVLLNAISPLSEMLGVALHQPRGWSLVVEAP